MLSAGMAGQKGQLDPNLAGTVVSVVDALTRSANGRPTAPTPATAAPAEPIRLDDGIVTTETERAVFAYVLRRLPFLIDREEALYEKLTHLYPRDYKTRFTVCYKQDRNGRLFNFQEMTQGPKFRFEFPDTSAVLQTDTLGDIDQELLTAYLNRVAELG